MVVNIFKYFNLIIFASDDFVQTVLKKNATEKQAKARCVNIFKIEKKKKIDGPS